MKEVRTRGTVNEFQKRTPVEAEGGVKGYDVEFSTKKCGHPGREGD